MSDSSSSGRFLVRKLDQAGWTLAADRVLRGLCHDLNGRLYSLSNLTYLLSTGGGEWSGVGSVVEEEVSRLEEAVRLLRLLPDDASKPGLLSPGERLPGIVRLVQAQPGLEGIQIRVEIPSGAPAVRMDETVFLRSVFLLLTGAAEQASLEKGGIVGVTGSEGEGLLRISPARNRGLAEGPKASEVSDTRMPPNMEALVAGVIQEVGGGLTALRDADGEMVLELRLPAAG